MKYISSCKSIQFNSGFCTKQNLVYSERSHPGNVSLFVFCVLYNNWIHLHDINKNRLTHYMFKCNRFGLIELPKSDKKMFIGSQRIQVSAEPRSYRWIIYITLYIALFSSLFPMEFMSIFFFLACISIFSQMVLYW